MALTVTEANAVNALLRFALKLPQPGGGPADLEQIRAAAELLADHANRTLAAGINGQRVRDAWPGRLRVTRDDDATRLRAELERVRADRDSLLNDRARIRHLWEHGDLAGAISAMGFNPDEVSRPQEGPAEPCGNGNEGWSCTEPRGHTGPHRAHNFHTWAQQPTTDDADRGDVDETTEDRRG